MVLLLLRNIWKRETMPEEYGYHIDENNNLIGKATKKDIIDKNLAHRGTMIYVFNSKGELLITKRAKKKKLYPGLLEIGQGGSMVYGEDYEEGARRELEEETGIKDVELEYLFDFWYKDNELNWFAKIYKCIYDGKINFQEEEIEDYFFISIEELEKKIKENPKQFCPDTLAQFREYLSFLDK